MRKVNETVRGFTLIEAMVGLGCALLVLLGAIGFAHHEIRTLGISRDNLMMTQAGRMSLDLLMDDLVNAGVGVGYDEFGQFQGLSIGPFNRGGAAFISDNRPIRIDHQDPNDPAAVGFFPTDDIGVVMAEGQHVTITFWDLLGNTAQVCGPSGFAADDILLVRSADGMSSKTIKLTSIALGSICVNGTTCEQGCEDLVIAVDPDASYSSGPSAANANYEGGTMAGGFKRITWFVLDTESDRPQLRRAEGNCLILDETCGDLVADYVDTLQMRVYERVGITWQDRTVAGIPLGSDNSVRVDVELVLRAAHEDTTGQIHPHARLVLEGDKCLPGPDTALPAACPGVSGSPNLLRRLVLRASVELKNAGRMRIN